MRKVQRAISDSYRHSVEEPATLPPHSYPEQEEWARQNHLPNSAGQEQTSRATEQY
jgi:hypothetical protein